MPNATLTDSNSIEYDASFPFPVTPVGGGPGGEAEVSIPDGADIALGSTTDDAYTGTEPYTAMSALRAIANAAISTAATPVAGNVASGATDSGNPVKVGGVYTVSLATLTAGQRGDLPTTDGGAVITAFAGRHSAANDTGANTNVVFPISSIGGASTATPRTGLAICNLNFDGTQWVRQRSNTVATGGAQVMELGPYSRGRVTADGQIKSSAGFIHTISIAPLTATPTAGLLTIYDSTTETGTVVYAEWIFATTPGHTVTLDIPCATGIYVGYDGALTNVQVTVAFR